MALRSGRSGRNGGRYDARGLCVCASALLTRSRHKSRYLQSRLMRRYPLRRASGARVSAVSSLNRSTARFIEDNSVLCPERRPGLSRSLLVQPSRSAGQRARQAVRHPSRPPLTCAGNRRSVERSRVGILTAHGRMGARRPVPVMARCVEPGKRHASHAPASLQGESAGSCRRPSRRSERTRRSSVRVSAPYAVPFVVTNRTGERSRAGRVLVVHLFIAACNAVGCWPSAKTFF